jgi:hypothetical protein
MVATGGSLFHPPSKVERRQDIENVIIVLEKHPSKGWNSLGQVHVWGEGLRSFFASRLRRRHGYFLALEERAPAEDHEQRNKAQGRKKLVRHNRSWLDDQSLWLRHQFPSLVKDIPMQKALH